MVKKNSLSPTHKIIALALFSLLSLIIFTTLNYTSRRDISSAFSNFKKIKLLNNTGTTSLNHPTTKTYYWDKKNTQLLETTSLSSTENGTLRQQPPNHLFTTSTDTYQLRQGHLFVYQDQKIFWQSPPEWWVDNTFAIADSNADGIMDLNMSVWKQGDFGPYKPFWIKKNNQAIQNHFFIFTPTTHTLKPVWQSSNLDNPNCEFIFTDLDQDSKDELIVIEGAYEENYQCVGKYFAVWKWNDWGFYNQWRSVAGNYKNLRALTTADQTIIQIESN
jgi:poly-gamma-glutamate synthesis protein (capsule biosynthesis protein)